MQLDYFGSLYVVKATLPAMVRRNKGQVLFIASPLAAIGESVSCADLTCTIVLWRHRIGENPLNFCYPGLLHP